MGPHAEIPSTIPIMPDEAKGMVGGQTLANLTREDGAMDGRHDLVLEFDHDGLCSELADQLMFISQDGTPFLFQG